VVSEKNGTWGRATLVPGLMTLGHAGVVNAVSCAPGGTCAAGGSYANLSGLQAFVADQN
jgi:hypothetical protein